ncbi:MAG: glycoside hydrolase family 3 C-terminal domain-containing protein, partial [Lachnospiraceae bacterium]|nr:glycoside hydrolase family 3 C-terminal domain-containing protein [Lachnospiraceae bacterium]
EIPYSVVGCKEHLGLAYQAAVESCVLLKNDGTLPLDKNQYHTIAVIGPNADSAAALVGNYNGTPPRAVTLLQGISDFCFANNIEVHYAQGCHLYDNTPPKKPHLGYFVTEGVIAAQNSDLAILCVGLDASLEGEQGDRGNQFPSGDKRDLLLPETQRILIEEVAKTGKPFLIINATGSPIDLSAYEEQAKAILQVWYPGGEGGRAVADILFGKAAPQGKLPVTFYYNENQIPDITDYAMKGRTYRYMKEKPWKPFGFGLTYGEAEICNVQAQGLSAEKTGEGKWHIAITDQAVYQEAVKNGLAITVTCTTKCDTCVSEVLQIYVHVNGTDNEVPNVKLAAFGRMNVLPDKETEKTFTIPAKAFMTVDSEGMSTADGDGADIYIGFSSEK